MEKLDYKYDLRDKRNLSLCMDFYEFASDLWGAVFWEHHFRGFFLGKIPLMKRLKWYVKFQIITRLPL